MRSKYLFLVLILSVFQRETIPLVFVIFSFIDYFNNLKLSLRQSILMNYHFRIMVTSLGASVFYFLFRRYLFPVSGFENQLVLSSLLSNLLNFRLTLTFIIPAFLSQNILAIYLFSVVINRVNTNNIRYFMILI